MSDPKYLVNHQRYRCSAVKHEKKTFITIMILNGVSGYTFIRNAQADCLKAKDVSVT